MMKKRHLLLITFLLLGSGLPCAQESTFEEFMQQNQQGFDEYREAEAEYLEKYTRQYEEYLHQQQQAFEEFRKEVERKWDEFRYPTRTEYVDYDEDLESRGSVDYKEGKVEVEVLTDPDDPEALEKAKRRIQEKITDLIQTTDKSGNSILEDQLRTPDGNPVRLSNAGEYAGAVTQERSIQSKVYTARDGKKYLKHAVAVPLVPDHLAKRAEKYKDEVIEQSQRFEIDPPITFAVIQTESNFNPKARSYVPAFGLMQLVPHTGARDAYIYVYKQDTLLTSDYLYIPQNNIELGCAYLSKLRNVYFRGVENDSSAYYCAIAAYNTGPGNVARALTGRSSVRSSIATINAHDDEWVYEKLVTDLPYDETRNYIQKVRGRIGIYHSWR